MPVSPAPSASPADALAHAPARRLPAAPGATPTPPSAALDGVALDGDAVGAPLRAELCRNCGEALAGAYCGACGQRRVTGRLTPRGMVGDVLEQLVVVDRGLWFTAAALTRDPGRMIRRYLDGERRRYVGPIAYLSILCAVQLFVVPLVFGTSDVDVVAAQARHMASGPHPFFTVAQAAAYTRANTVITEQALWTSLVMAVPFALVFRRAFRRTGLNAAEMAVFAIYTFAHSAALYTPLVPVVRLANGGMGMRFVVSNALWLAVVLRASPALFGGSAVRTTLRALWAWLLAYLLTMLVLGVGLIAAIKLFVH